MPLFDFLKTRPTPARFAQIVTAWLRQRGITDDVHFDAAEFRLDLPGGLQHFLHNHYQDYCAAWPWHRQRVLAAYLTNLTIPHVPMAELWSVARDHLLPVLREGWQADQLNLWAELKGHSTPELVRKPLTKTHELQLAYDMPGNIAYVGPTQLADWGVSVEQAFAIALTNLRALTPPQVWTSAGPGLFCSAVDDCYDAGRLLLSDQITALPLRGRPIALPVHRSVLLIAGEDDDHALQLMAQAALAPLNDHRHVSGIPLVLESGRWQVLERHDTGGPGRIAVENLARHWASSIANDHSQLLEQRAQKRGEDIFVASAMIIGDPSSGREYTWCTWTNTVETLLPETDLVALCDPDRPGDDPTGLLGLFFTSALQAHCGHLLRAEAGIPGRWRTTGFPDAAAIAALAAHRFR